MKNQPQEIEGNYNVAQDSEVVTGIHVRDSANQILSVDRPIHAWYRFVLSFPPHLVRQYLSRFGISAKMLVLDPFCGTGTTIVECKKQGIASIGIEANPMAHFASRTKIDWGPDPAGLIAHAEHIANLALQTLKRDGVHDELLAPPNEIDLKQSLRTLPESLLDLLLTNSISPLPLHKVLVLLETLARDGEQCYFNHERLALAKALVSSIGNLHFGPEVGIGTIKTDALVVPAWLEQIREMGRDLRDLAPNDTFTEVILADSRQLLDVVEPQSIDFVFTSPPYPNEKDYTRTTRLESVLLGFIADKADLKALKRGLIRSNTRGVSVEDDDDSWVDRIPAVQQIAQDIEARRVSLGKTSGFERLYARVTKLYFGGMARHLADLRYALRPGARLGYVVGDQASYLRIMIRTGQILGQIAEELGYKLVGIDLFRTRLATATRDQLREEVVLLEWPGDHRKTGVLISEYVRPMTNKNRYIQIIERIFGEKFRPGAREVDFSRDEIVRAAKELDIRLPKNLGDVIYSFRYRVALPESIREKAPQGTEWVIRPAGPAQYRFVAIDASAARIVPDKLQAVTKVPDATPGVISKYALSDEQALLARLRYNRLIDLFTGVTCYSLQNHLRTNVPNLGQVETDEVYVGIDKRGAQFVFPVQAKGGRDALNIVQIEQDVAMCASKFPSLICHPIAAQFVNSDLIALFRFESGPDGVSKIAESHYKLVPPDEVSEEDLRRYADRPIE